MTEKVKDIARIAKEAGLILLFLIFFLFPSRVSNPMQRANFYQGSVKSGHTLIQENLHPNSFVTALKNIDKQLKMSIDSLNLKTNRIPQQDFINRISDNKAEWQPGKPKRIDSVKPPDDAMDGL
jgi:hypothetical protein